MANKRSLKKKINTACENIAQEILEQTLEGTFTIEQANDMLNQLANTQEAFRAAVSASFDHVTRDFESRKAFNAERAKYFHAAMKSLEAKFGEALQQIVNQMNALRADKK